MAKKSRTLDQVEKMQAKAVRFLRDVQGDEDKAEEFEAMSPEEYAERKHVSLIENPCFDGEQIQRRITTMPNQPTLAELKAKLADLEDENASLQEENDALNDKIDSILDIAVDEDEDDDEDDSEDDDSDDDDE